MHAVRAAIQLSRALPARLHRELGINPKTVTEWRERATIVAFRLHTLLPSDDGL
jgi:hypothetical protein